MVRAANAPHRNSRRAAPARSRVKLPFLRPLDRYVASEFIEDLRHHRAGISAAGDRDRPDGPTRQVSEPASHAGADRARVRLLVPRIDLHGAAGRGAVRDGVHDRIAHAALGAHGGKGVGDQLLPAARAHLRRRRDRHDDGVRARGSSFRSPTSSATSFSRKGATSPGTSGTTSRTALRAAVSTRSRR